jgi:phospholipase/lecithinase/hemolysin
MPHAPTVRQFGAAIAVLTLAATSLSAQAGTYSGLFAFGDSLNDVGRVFALTGTPQAPYFNGHYSNGPVMVEYLAQNLGLPLVSYAWGGATTGLLNLNAGLNAVLSTGVLAQVAEFGTAHVGGADPSALYFVMAGPNDFFPLLSSGAPPAQLQAAASAAVTNLATAVGSLYGMGARNFLLPLMPNLGATVSAAKAEAVQPGAIFGASLLTAAFNGALAGAYGQLGLALAGETMYVVDTPTIVAGLASQYSVTTSASCLDMGAFPACTGYMFFDDVHPTTALHRQVAQALTHVVPEPSSWWLGGVALLAAGAASRRRRAG